MKITLDAEELARILNELGELERGISDYRSENELFLRRIEELQETLREKNGRIVRLESSLQDTRKLLLASEAKLAELRNQDLWEQRENQDLKS